MTATVERTGFSPARTLPNGQPFYSPYGAFPFQADEVGEVIERTEPGGDSGHIPVFDTGCIHGDSEIILNRCGKGFRMKLRDVVHRFNGGAPRGGSAWDLNFPTYVQREVDGVVRLGQLTGAWDSGVKTTFTVTTETGRTIRATDEHPFLTERGWLRLDELVVGDLVHVRGEQASGRARKPKVYYREVAGLRHHPHATRRTVKNSSFRVFEHRLVAEAVHNGLPYLRFIALVRAGQLDGLEFLDPKVWAVHHIDHDYKNNAKTNLKVLTHAEHHALHAEEGKTESVLYKVAHERVASIERYGQEQTFDLSVADEPHNFLADGFVVHNTGKTIIAAAAAAFLYTDAKIDQVVVIAELNVIEDWREAIEEFTTLSAMTYHGSGREKRLEKFVAQHGELPHVFVTTYETGAREFVVRENPGGKRKGRRFDGPLIERLGLRHKRTLYVFDEITKLRNRKSDLYSDYDYLVTQVRRTAFHQRVIGLTATPLSTDYGNGFNIGRIACPERLPSITEFEREAISAVDDHGHPTYRKSYEPVFARMFQGIITRKRKTDPDVAQYFPRQHESATHVELTIPHREFYEAIEALFDPPEGEQDMRNSREVVDDEHRLWNLLRMSAGHPAAHLHAGNPSSRAIVEELGEDVLRGIGSSKTPVLLDELDPFRAKGWPVVVFSFYRSVLAEVGRELTDAGVSYVEYNGGMTKSAREKAKKTFLAGNTEVFLATDAAARGMNLQVSPAVIEYESALTFEKRTQRNNRVHRITSPWSDVWCKVLILNDTVEDGGVNLALNRNESSDTMVGDEEDETGFISAETRRERLRVSRGRRNGRAGAAGSPLR